ncbi:MAG: phenylalanine--tRNA ligase subunit beta [Candidatus Buchananbacteria bacterium]
MNLNISYNWLKSYVKTSLTPQEFAKRISLSGPSVDRVQEKSTDFGNVVVGKMLEISKHPNADKLNVAKVDVGKKEPIQVIFGQMAVLKVGDQLPVAIAPTTLPSGVEILEREMRGVKSQGMCCLDSEIGLSDQDRVTFFPPEVKPGTPIAKALKLEEDAILDIEITSNRPDAMSVIGIAREAAAILDAKFLYKQPNPSLAIRKSVIPAHPEAGIHNAGSPTKLGMTKKGLPLSIKITEPRVCPRYSAIVMTDVKVGASPLWMQQRLLASGLRPINNLVDITNYILLEYGQPMHVFDYDKLLGGEINVRKAKKSEKILALDGKEYELSVDQLVIADKQNPVAVAGVMGGELSAATAETKTIVFECANFNPVSVRKTSRVLNLRSESSALYEKGISPENVTAAMLRAIELAQQLCDAKVAGKLIDEKSYKYKDREIILDLERVDSALGVKIKPAEIKNNLEALGFKVIAKRDKFKVTIPWWRENDMEGQHDLIEEIARMHGYQNLPTELMSGALPQTIATVNFALEDKIKDALVGFGLTEVYTYSFISEKQILGAGLKSADHIKIANPLSADFEYMRTSLLPGVLQIIAENQGFFPAGRLFDLSQVYLPLGANDLADEKFKLLAVCYGADAEGMAADARGVLDGLMQRLNIDNLTFKKKPAGSEIYVNDVKLGEIKVIDNKILSAFGIKKAVAAVELDFAAVAALAKSAPTYRPIPKFPAIELDLSMEVDNVITFAEVANVASDAGAPLVDKVDFLSVYQGEKLPEGKKALAIRMVYRDLNKTLELAEAQIAHDKVVAELKKSYNIVVR